MRHFSKGLLAFLVVLYLAGVVATVPLLPERMATHFNAAGQADGWMTRSGYLAFNATLGVALPLFILLIVYLSRFLPASLVNIPHREFWLAPERRALAQTALLDHSFWLACLMVAFFAALHAVTIVANRRTPAALPNTVFFPVLGAFLLGTGLWIYFLYRKFRKG
jgi:uncharacterized membrane protein